MAAMNFPNGPALGDKYPVTPIVGQPQYTWDGEKWTTVGSQISNATPSAAVPLMDATPGLAGTAAAYSRGDHVHPTDTTRAALSYVDANMVGYAAQTTTANQKAQARANVNVTKRNYITNGAMQVSQENGTTTGTTNLYYPVDMFNISFGNAGAVSIAQEANPTPAGSPNRLVVACITADTAVGAGDYSVIGTTVEGLRAADLGFGTATAKTITIQFGVVAPAGTYCVSVMNAASNRCYVAEYVISAGEAGNNVVKSVVIPGDTSGTWAKDNTIGLTVRWGLMAGTTYQTAAGSWAAGNFVGSSNQFNFMGTASTFFRLFDVSLTEGAVAPPFQLPDYATELALCQRYYYKRTFTAGNSWISTLQAYSTTSASGFVLDLPTTMRAAPSAAASGPFNVTNAAGSGLSFTGFSLFATPDFVYTASGAVASGLVAGNAALFHATSASCYFTFSARL